MTLYQIKQLGRDRPIVYGWYYHRPIIYRITNLVNGKIYIGLTTCLQKRLKSHLYHSCVGDGQLILHKAIKKYGLENIDFEIIECPSAESLSEREKHWILHYQSMDYDKGYNLREGGYNGKPNDAVKSKMRQSAKNKKPVYVYDMDGKYIASYESINACASAFNVRHCTVRDSIKNGALVRRTFRVVENFVDCLPSHVSQRSARIAVKLKGNRNCTPYTWVVKDKVTGMTYHSDSLIKIAEQGDYKESALRSLAYGRACRLYKNRLVIEKHLKS